MRSLLTRWAGRYPSQRPGYFGTVESAPLATSRARTEPGYELVRTRDEA